MKNKKVLLAILLGGVILALPITGAAKKKASGNSTVYFKSCKEARAAGYSDIKKAEFEIRLIFDIIYSWLTNISSKINWNISSVITTFY